MMCDFVLLIASIKFMLKIYKYAVINITDNNKRAVENRYFTFILYKFIYYVSVLNY